MNPVTPPIAEVRQIGGKTVVEGKFGLYPCSKEHYFKLKRLRFLAYQAMCRYKRHDRWAAKRPQNRVHRMRAAKALNLGLIKELPGRNKWVVLGPWFEPILCSVQFPIDGLNTQTPCGDLQTDYMSARYPKATAAEVQPLALSEAKVDELLKQAENWYAEQPIAAAHS
jgi:hypothetical protein